jgi:hypothetical protein
VKLTRAIEWQVAPSKPDRPPSNVPHRTFRYDRERQEVVESGRARIGQQYDEWRRSALGIDRREALGQRLQWWLAQWAGWERPRVRLCDVRTWWNPARDSVTVEWSLSDGRRLYHEIDGMALEHALRERRIKPTDDAARLMARSLADHQLHPYLTRPPWEVPGA